MLSGEARSDCPQGDASADRVGNGWRLLVLLAAVFMTTADNSIVNVAVPSISARLDASGGELQLVVSGYILAYAVLLVTGARLGSLFGYRRIFLFGLGAFTLASLACGLAPDPLSLIVARVIQGVGAALMVPQVLSGIQLNFDGTARARAVTYYSVALAGGAAAGQALGGALISLNPYGSSWRSIFLVNVPIGAALFTLARRRLPLDEKRRRERLDVIGVVAFTTALLLFVLPLMLGRGEGWPAWTWLSLLASVPASAAFIALERRVGNRGGHPLVQPRLFSSRAVSWGLSAQATATATYAALLFVLALYLQRGLGESPFYSGTALLSWVIGFGLSGPLLRSVPTRVSDLGAPAGFCLLASAFVAIALESLISTPRDAPLVVALGLGGLGMGIGFSSLIAALTTKVQRDLAPDLSGMVSTNSEVFSAIGVATFGTLYLALADGDSAPSAVRALRWVTAAFGVSALLAAAAALRGRRSATAGDVGA
jgi:predicted MFS family arabinose efflux permease